MSSPLLWARSTLVGNEYGKRIQQVRARTNADSIALLAFDVAGDHVQNRGRWHGQL